MTNEEALKKAKSSISPEAMVQYDSRAIEGVQYMVAFPVRDDKVFTGSWCRGQGSSWEAAFKELDLKLAEYEKDEERKAHKKAKAGDKVSS
jgi:hypothetical protein